MTNKFLMSEKTAKTIRTVTIAPIIAFIVMTIIYLFKPDLIGGFLPYILLVLFLCIFPILAYPLQPYVPYFKDKGRTGQRNFSILMSLIGYVFGLLSTFILKDVLFLKIIFLTYLLSAMLIAVFSKILKFNASGHTCGVAGPLTILTYVFGAYALFGFLILPLVFWASIKLKRHTIAQLTVGSVIPIVLFVIMLLIF